MIDKGVWEPEELEDRMTKLKCVMRKWEHKMRWTKRERQDGTQSWGGVAERKSVGEKVGIDNGGVCVGSLQTRRAREGRCWWSKKLTR